MKKILLATDFSERSDRALRRATLLARQFDAVLSIVHVVDDDQPRRKVDSDHEAASALLQDLQGTIRNVDGISCETSIVLADPFAGIARAAEEAGPDLLVIGPHRRQVLRDMFVGTTAERTIRSVVCAVLMVNATPAGPYHHVLFATDLSKGSERAASASRALGIARGARTSVLHVYEAPAKRLAMSQSVPADDWDSYLEELRKDAQSNLARFVQAADMGAARQLLRRGLHAPAEEILRAAEEESADLIAVGTHGRSGFARFLLGSVAEAVLRNADRDVLAIPLAAS